MTLRALLAAAAVVALAGCASTGPVGGTGPSSSPDAASQPPAAAPDGPHLTAEGVVFDPIAHDVEPDDDCEGLPGRDELDAFDRAAWPALDVAAGEAIMTCGNADGAGWRHIADGHTGDFGELAEPVGAEWEDVAWFAIDRALEQPTRVEEYRDDIVNYDVLVELVDDDQTQRAWMVTVGVGLSSGHIITAFPDEQR
ncbi:hypothetical protein [Agrococcus beijingensis]|uniref:hypothetical protein n=1 Tax=Agrococcus beijingensis TaxID=3068634 RepID=UPI002741FC68|nr:hypothetical protein [Agrococcus sp. REN33]